MYIYCCLYNKKYQLVSTDQTPGGVQLELNSSDQNKKDTRFKAAWTRKSKQYLFLPYAQLKNRRLNSI